MIFIQIDFKLERFQKEIKHSLDFIFQSLGYSYAFIGESGLAKLKTTDILLIYAFSEPSMEDLKVLAKHSITIYIPADAELYDPKVYSGGKLKRNLKEVKLISPTPVISPRSFNYPAENYSEMGINAGKFNFDLVANVFFHLATLEEQIDPQRNEAGFYPEESSLFFQYKELPFVDNMLWLMDNMLKEHNRKRKQYLVQKKYWPHGEDGAAILTHSVDDLQRWNLQSFFLSIADDVLMFVTLSWNQLWHQIVGKLRYVFTNIELNWNFGEFRKLEADAGLPSAYFVSGQNTDGIDYSLDDPDLMEELRDITKAGNEVGILMVPDQKNRDEQRSRKQILQDLVKADQMGLRALDFQIDTELAELHDHLSPAYTMSSSLQNSPGYKHGISLPFVPWLQIRKANQYEIPTVFRDRFLKIKRYKLMSLEDAKHQFKRVLEKTNRTHGIMALDFRVASYTDIHYCPKLYPYIMALLKSAGFWICKPLDMAQWWYKRSRVLIDQGDYEFSVSFKDDMESLCLQITGDVKIVEIDGVSAKIEGNGIRFQNVKADSIAVIRLDHKK